MKRLLLTLIVSILAAAVGGFVIACIANESGLWKSVFVVVFPFCFFVGLSLCAPWINLIRRRSFGFAALLGMTAGGIAGSALILLTYCLSSFHGQIRNLCIACGIWAVIGALVGGLYVLAMKSILAGSNKG